MTFRLPFFKPQKTAPARLEDTATRANNPNLYSNPIPTFNPVQPQARRAPAALNALVVLPLNLCLFTNPIPFNQPNWAPAQQARELPQQTQNNNLVLTSAITPFSQTNWSKVSPVNFLLPEATQQTNLNLFTNPIPVSTPDWSKPYAVKPIASDQNNLPNTFALNNTVVVVGTEKLRAPYLSRAFVRDANPSDVTWPNIALAPQQAAGSPFVQTDWPRATPLRIATFDTYNIVLFDGSVPFNKLDWAQVEFPPPRAPDQQPYNLALRSQAVVAAPFYQTDWSTPRRSPSQPDRSAPLNLNLFTNPIPFAQLDWSKTTFQEPRAPDQQNYNLALSFVFVQPPFSQLDWSKTVFQTPRLPDASVRLNLNLYQNPIPFSQLDWSKTVFQTPRLPDASVQSNLVLNPPPLPPPPDFAVEIPPQNSAAGIVVGKKKKKKPEPPPVIRRAVYELIVEKPEPEVEETIEARVEEVKAEKVEPFKGSLLDLAPLPAMDAKAALKRKQEEEEEIALYLLGFK